VHRNLRWTGGGGALRARDQAGWGRRAVCRCRGPDLCGKWVGWGGVRAAAAAAQKARGCAR
jgi:hypothetical protein